MKNKNDKNEYEMIKNYNGFITNYINEEIGMFKKKTESNIIAEIKRENLKIGDKIMTNGEVDGVNLDYLAGTIIDMKEYGNFLIEFDEPNKKFHAGFKDIGKKGHCFYIPLKNIASNDPIYFEKIIKKHEEDKKNEDIRMNTKYKIGDVIVGIGSIKIGYGNKSINIDDEIAITYYPVGQDQWWVGFLDKTDKNFKSDNEGFPKNGAGITINKMNMRHAEPEEIDKFKKKIDKIKKELDKIGQPFQLNDIIVVEEGRYDNVDFKNNIGIIREVISRGIYNRYSVQFTNRFDDNLYDVNNLMGVPMGYVVPQNKIRSATEEELKKNELELKLLKDNIESFNYDYKVGDYIIAQSSQNFMLDNMDGQIGEIVNIAGNKPRDNFGINFMIKFCQQLYVQGKNKNYYNLPRANISIIKKEESEDIKRKLDNKEIMLFITSDRLSMILYRLNLKIKSALMNLSYFDITDTNEMISYIPLDKFKRLDDKENPFKSRFRQMMKIGKFFRIVNEKLTDKDVESLTNAYKATYDLCIKGISDKLKLVSGEDIRYWYNGANYVQGGGMLNSSCMRGTNKAPEMQMFVDNPDVIQMLVLLNDDGKKLLGRALVWRLAVPEDGTFMDYVYTRYDKDRDLFQMYATNEGWITREGNSYRSNMICALHTDKKYQQGINALDHFDTFHLVSTQNYLTNGDNNWKNPYMKKKEGSETTEIKKIESKFKEGDKIIYKKDKSVYDNKKGIFIGVRPDGKYSIQFDEGNKRFAANAQNVYPYTEK